MEEVRSSTLLCSTIPSVSPAFLLQLAADVPAPWCFYCSIDQRFSIVGRNAAYWSLVSLEMNAPVNIVNTGSGLQSIPTLSLVLNLCL
jgi:hypothetical protein